MASPTSIRSLTLDLPPSCIQFCPSKPSIFVVGTYFLHRNAEHGRQSQDSGGENASSIPDVTSIEPSAEKTQKRTGSLVLYELSDDNNITEVSCLATDFAILDVQWAPPHPDRLVGNSSSPGDPLLAVAASTGLLAFYRLREKDAHACSTTDDDATTVASAAAGVGAAQQYELVLSCVKQISDDMTLVLSLTWHPSQPNVLGVTLSDGRVVLCNSSGNSDSAEGSYNDDHDSAVAYWDSNAVIDMHDVHTHELEAWILNFSPEASLKGPHSNVTKVFSGGDDMMLQCSQQQIIARQDHTAEEQQQDGARFETLWQDRKLHQAGVTAILPLSDTLVITGSYDDHIRLLYLPPAGRRKTLAEMNLGGGVWRLKLLTPSSSAPPSTNSDPSRTAAQPNHKSSDSTTSERSAHADQGSGPMSALQDSADEQTALATRTATAAAVLTSPAPWAHNNNNNNNNNDDDDNDDASSCVLLCSCMHAGTRIVRLTSRRPPPPQQQHTSAEWEGEFEVLAQFEEHASMNYGSDVQPWGTGGKRGRKKRIVSTSFYDKKMCLWEVDV